jgi:hypothetical protein
MNHFSRLGEEAVDGSAAPVEEAANCESWAVVPADAAGTV